MHAPYYLLVIDFVRDTYTAVLNSTSHKLRPEIKKKLSDKQVHELRPGFFECLHGLRPYNKK